MKELTVTSPVNIDGGESLETKTVIYAAGTQRRKLGVKGEKEFSGNGVSYCAVCVQAFYKDKITDVTGGGDTALGERTSAFKILQKGLSRSQKGFFQSRQSLAEQGVCHGKY